MKYCYGLEDVMGFGKHKDKTLKEIIDNYDSYFEWVITNVEGFRICYHSEQYLQDVDDELFEEYESIVSSHQASVNEMISWMQEHVNNMFKDDHRKGKHQFLVGDKEVRSYADICFIVNKERDVKSSWKPKFQVTVRFNNGQPDERFGSSYPRMTADMIEQYIDDINAGLIIQVINNLPDDTSDGDYSAEHFDDRIESIIEANGFSKCENSGTMELMDVHGLTIFDMVDDTRPPGGAFAEISSSPSYDIMNDDEDLWTL